MIPWPAFDVLTPLGIAECNGVDVDGQSVEWLCWIKATGEPFFWRNQCIRRNFDLTSGLPMASPFTEVPNTKLQSQIDRYIKNGWLPPDWMKRFPTEH